MSLAEIGHVDLVKWQYLRTESEYRNFISQLIKAGTMKKKNLFYVIDKKSKGASQAIQESQANWDLVQPLDFKNLRPKTPLFQQTPVRMLEDEGKLLLEIDTSFKSSQILSRVKEILDKISKRKPRQLEKNSNQHNTSLNQATYSSRAYELIYEDRLGFLETAKVLKSEFLKLKNRNEVNLERQIRESWLPAFEKIRSNSNEKNYRTFRHWLSLLSQDDHPLEDDFNFMEELNKI